MSAAGKVFRIEKMNGAREPIAHAHNGSSHHREIIAELKALRALVKPREELSERTLDAFKAQIAEAQKLKSELDLIHEAINRTKREIATLHVGGFEGPEMARVTHELDAIVGGTEQATDQILEAAEYIEETAQTLDGIVSNERDRALTHDIQERVVKIFEACNFQDLTGQRITKVVATLKFIETHILRMMDIWGGLDAFKEIEAETMPQRMSDAKLVNGPKLEGEVGHASQDDIDALFA